MKSLLKSCKVTSADVRDAHGIAAALLAALAKAHETVGDFVVLM